MPSPARNSAHPVPPNRECIQFDRFDLDLRSGELRKSGHRIRLQAQPFQLLALLLKHPGEVVTRDEIRRTLWETDTFVDFDHSLAAAVNKIRGALGDSAESPRFVETLPKRGYRFIGEVRRQPAPLAVAKPSVDPEGAAISQATWHSGWPGRSLKDGDLDSAGRCGNPGAGTRLASIALASRVGGSDGRAFHFLSGD